MFLDVNPKSTVVNINLNPQDFKPLMLNMSINHIDVNLVSAVDCKEFLISLEKELKKLLECKPSIKEMNNMGIYSIKI